MFLAGNHRLLLLYSLEEDTYHRFTLLYSLEEMALFFRGDGHRLAMPYSLEGYNLRLTLLYSLEGDL